MDENWNKIARTEIAFWNCGFENSTGKLPRNHIKRGRTIYEAVELAKNNNAQAQKRKRENENMTKTTSTLGQVVEEIEVEEEENRQPSDPTPINYAREAEKIEESQNRPPLWKPESGMHKVKFCSEMSKIEFSDKQTGKIQQRAVVDVEVKGEKHVIMCGLGSTPSSLYGQLIVFAAAKKGLMGRQVIITVTMRKNRNGESVKNYALGDPEQLK